MTMEGNVLNLVHLFFGGRKHVISQGNSSCCILQQTTEVNVLPKPLQEKNTQNIQVADSALQLAESETLGTLPTLSLSLPTKGEHIISQAGPSPSLLSQQKMLKSGKTEFLNFGVNMHPVSGYKEC